MTTTTRFDDLIKVEIVIESCKTLDHFRVAKRMADNFYKTYNILRTRKTIDYQVRLQFVLGEQLKLIKQRGQPS